MIMKVFDFDNTLYDGECSLDFFIHCLKKKKSLIKYVPPALAAAAKYKTGHMPVSEVYDFADKLTGVFFDNCEDIDEIAAVFWETHEKKLKPDMLKKISPTDAVISASPRFIFDALGGRLGTDNILCTELDEKNKKLGFLCYGENKVKAFRDRFGNAAITEFYTDNLNDLPLIELAQSAFLVSGSDVSQIK